MFQVRENVDAGFIKMRYIFSKIFMSMHSPLQESIAGYIVHPYLLQNTAYPILPVITLGVDIRLLTLIPANSPLEYYSMQ